MLGDVTDVAMRELRSSKSHVAARGSVDHASLGRLLRLFADPRSDETHVAAAIEHHQSKARGALSTPATTSARVLALSDHRHISNIGSVLSAVDHAIAALDAANATHTSDATAARNMLRALVTALATQSVSECKSTKHNVCVWTAPSKKRLKLLQWLLSSTSVAFTIVVDDALRELLEGDKTSQLTACLVVFELAQRHRRAHHGGDRSMRGQWSVLLDPLLKVVHNGSVQTASGPKPSQLGVAALDALLAVLCLATDALDQQHRVLECMEFALSTLVQWHARSARRQWLVMAARQLASLAAMGARGGTSELFTMIAWHWNATVMWLCARSDCVLAVKKSLVEIVARTVNDVHHVASTNGGSGGVEQIPQHKIVATLRQLCALLSLYAGRSMDLLPSVAAQGKLLIALISCVAAPTAHELALGMLRRLLIGDNQEGTDPVLSLSPPVVEAFVSMIQRSCVSIESLGRGVTSLVAELGLRAGLTVPEDHSSDDSATARFWLSVTDRALDLCVTIPTFDNAMRTQWLRDTTKAVLHVLHHHVDKDVRTHAAALVPKLDLVVCMQYIASQLLLDIDTRTSGCLVALIFQYAEGNQALATELASVLIDTLCRGTSIRHRVSNPSDLRAASATHEHTNGEEDLQTVMLTKSQEGWCTRVTRSTQTILLEVLIGKAFGSPRDSALVAWLRELSLLGWFDDALESILPMVTTHMKNMEKLTEELLEDDSTHASRAVEHLLFARLAPNLVLRVIPRTSFLSLYTASPHKLLTKVTEAQNPVTNCLSELAQALWSQVSDPLEYKEVKMLSIELLTKLPVQEILPRVLATLTAFVASQGTPMAVVKLLAAEEGLYSADGGGFVVAKLLMYFLNLVFTDESTTVHDVAMLDKTLSLLLTVLSLPCAPDEAFSAEKSPLVDLQMGTIECISLLVARSLKSQDSAKLRLVEDAIVQVILTGLSKDSTRQHLIPLAEDRQGHDHRLQMFQSWKAVAHDATAEHSRFSETQVRICCCNVLLSALARADAHAVSTFQNRILRMRMLPSMRLGLPPPVLAGCLQIAFSFFFKAGATLGREDKPAAEITLASVAIIIQVLKSSQVKEDSVCMNALKLLGALIGKVSWLWPSLAGDTTTQQAVATGLQRLRDASSTTSPPVRQLAQSLLEAILSG